MFDPYNVQSLKPIIPMVLTHTCIHTLVFFLNCHNLPHHIVVCSVKLMFKPAMVLIEVKDTTVYSRQQNHSHVFQSQQDHLILALINIQIS